MDVTRMLQDLESGDEDVLQELIPLVYGELKKLARAKLQRESNLSLETTVLVHEAFIRMTGHRHPHYESRSHFYGIASRLMRQVLVDAARARYAEKRGAGLEIPLAELPDVGSHSDRSILVLHDCLEMLQRRDPQVAKLVEMRYFGGLTAQECALALSLPTHVVRRELRFAQAWLKKEMSIREL
jgi:RNA polymerase sigma-70 factor, ECF subfamily